MSGVRKCGICTHTKRAEIERELIKGVSGSAIAERLGVSHDTVNRHAREHLPAKLAKMEAVAVDEAAELRESMRFLHAEAMAILQRCTSYQHPKMDETALKAIRELARLNELQAKRLGEIDKHQTMNVYVTPEWSRLESILLAACDRSPELKDAIMAVLDDAKRGA